MSEDNIRNYFRLERVDGAEKVVCTICDRVIRKHIHCMRMHFAMHERQCTSPTPHRAEDDAESGDDEEYSEDNAPDISSHPERLRAEGRGYVVKRTVKYLVVCPSAQVFDGVVRCAPDDVIETISDAAHNVKEGQVHLTEAQKNLFRTHRAAIDELISPEVSTERKREVIESQRGWFAFLPLLISAALSALGGSLFGGTS